jgi:hypothetical protein
VNLLSFDYELSLARFFSVYDGIGQDICVMGSWLSCRRKALITYVITPGKEREPDNSLRQQEKDQRKRGNVRLNVSFDCALKSSTIRVCVWLLMVVGLLSLSSYLHSNPVGLIKGSF